MNEVSKKAKCVFASEINDNAIKIYELNFNQSSDNDIEKTEPQDIEDFDVVCAGFPCQPFSKAGSQNGFNDTRGTLFFDIVRIIKGKIESGHKPKMLILENVRNLATHDNYRTWHVIKNALNELGYNTDDNPLILSPADFNVPQLRDRSIIMAIDSDIYSEKIEFTVTKQEPEKTIYEILEKEIDIDVEKYKISDYENRVLSIWDEFIKIIGPQTLGFPIWS